MKIIDGFRLRDVMGQATIVGEGVGQLNFNKLITLNPSAAYLWQSVQNREFTVEELATLLVEHYNVDTTIALRDATNIAQQWAENGVIE